MQLHGIRAMRYGGVVFNPIGEVTINVGGQIREVTTDAIGVDGFIEKPEAASAKFLIRDRRDLDIPGIKHLSDDVLTVDLKNGKTFVFTEAFSTGSWEMNTETGAIEGEVMAATCEQI